MSDKRKSDDKKAKEETLEQFLKKIQKNKREEREVLEKLLRFLDEQDQTNKQTNTK